MKNVLKVDQLGPPKTLIMMIGLPYSGKSTEAKKRGYPMVCPDAIRVSLHGRKFIPEAEPMVWAIAQYMVRALFLSGHDTVTLDATNLTSKRRDAWITKDWNIAYLYINTPKEVCMQRAKDNGDEDIIPIIEKMAQGIEPTVGGMCL